MSVKFYTLISGATGGIGKAFSVEFARLKKNLILLGRSNEKLEELKKQLLEIQSDIDIVTFCCDLSSKSERKKLFCDITDGGYIINQLINVAGVDTQKKFQSYTQEKLVFQCRVVYESVVSLTLFALSQKQSELQILTISSICGKLPIPYFAIYSSLKGALISFFDALRIEYSGDKSITITTVLPGSVPTRPDIIEDIKIQGLTGKLSQKSPTFVAKKSIKALNKRKKNYIPGFFNNIVNFIQTLVPKTLKTRFMAKRFKNKEKDAF